MKVFRLFTIAVIVSLLGSACTLIPSPTPTATPTRVPPTATPTITPTPTLTFTPTPFYAVESGRTLTVRAGGFSFTRVKDYASDSGITGAVLTSTDEKVTVEIFAQPRPAGLTIIGMIKQFDSFMDERNDSYTHSELITETIGDIEKVTSEFSGFQDGEPMRGMISIYEPRGSKVIHLVVTAVGDQRWEREGRKVFDLITNSLSIFPIEIFEDCPIAGSSSYGRSTGNPIRIGGGLVEGANRSEVYLNSLLGPNGEPVNFLRVGVERGGNGVNLDEYVLLWNDQITNIFIDIYSYAPLFVPQGFTCSVALPSAPF